MDLNPVEIRGWSTSSGRAGDFGGVAGDKDFLPDEVTERGSATRSRYANWDVSGFAMTKTRRDVLRLTEPRSYRNAVAPFSLALAEAGGLPWEMRENENNFEEIVSGRGGMDATPSALKTFWEPEPRVDPRLSGSDQLWAEGWNSVGIRLKICELTHQGKAQTFNVRSIFESSADGFNIFHLQALALHFEFLLLRLVLLDFNLVSPSNINPKGVRICFIPFIFHYEHRKYLFHHATK